MLFETWRAKTAALITGTAAAAVTTGLLLAPMSSPTNLAAAATRWGTTATTTTTTTAPPTCQGASPLGLSGSWNCTFDDEFNGSSLNTHLWQPQLTATSLYVAGPDCYVNNPSTISESGGYLNLSVVKVPQFQCVGSYSSQYQAGMVTTSGHFSQTYGAFEVNAKLPVSTAPGLQETFWLYPQTLLYGKWPASGELDFAEFFSNYSNLDIPNIHYTNSASDPNATSTKCVIDPTKFNTYEVNWTPKSITMLYNGNVCITDTPIGGPAPFNDPFFIALTQALGLTGSNAVNAATPLPATTQVDWVRAWTPAS